MKQSFVVLAKSRLGATISLDEFLFRQQVKHIYRRIMRVAYNHHEKDELIRFIRPEFKVANTSDLAYRKYLLSQGVIRINDMATIMGINLSL